MNPLKLLWRAMRAVLLALAAAVLFIEEWGWRPLQRLEQRIRGVSPRVALLLFLAPAALLFPIKLLALWLIHLGHGALGVAVIVAAKLLGTAGVGRLFILTEPQLMTIRWFAHALGWWRATKERVRVAVHASAAARALRAAKRRWRLWARRSARTDRR